ncbi:MAG TPA: MoxR family ATPase [Gammaproteobacteria bacterium]|nr:MoxR family ATPase [Xanthomonadales bacterium]HOP22005.1 MoxR family ATPase [Gammaproteobacteria bacterium]HPI94823.1 MoxR family ATPase [Gammaproteobacteria bacterium]HPQ86416.1 MoxR family ATPase [Gammaproteobacteria bacterium]
MENNSQQEISETAKIFQQVKSSLSQEIFGQEKLVNRLLMALLTHGHLLVEGAPGLAKTTAIKALADRLEGDFKRIQFTPDLLPSDLTGTEIYRAQTGSFEFQKGPLFHNLILADEVNRAPAKVQSALLEAMGEQQITIGSTTYQLPKLFLVMATQNPIEQEGTYPLPEAQLDRFQMHVAIDYPDADTEKDILKLAQDRDKEGYQKPSKDSVNLTQQNVFDAQQQVLNLYVADNLQNYMVELILATRNPIKYDKSLAEMISFGGSPRATIALDRCARAHAFLQGREHLLPEDIHNVIYDVLRHRLILSFEAEVEGITPDKVIDRLLKVVPIA